MNEKSHATLLVNLGSPKELDKKSVREYLKIFLSDDYVVDIPKNHTTINSTTFYLAIQAENNTSCL